MNFRKTFLHRVSSKALLLTTIIALFAIAAVGLALVPTFNGSSKAAIERVSQDPGDQIASAEMLKVALNFKSAAGYKTLAANSDGVEEQTRRDLSNAFSTISQLPCTELKGANLGGKSFSAGVYCLDSAELASQMTLDAADDVSSVFVFVVRGDLTAKAGAGIALTNRAQAANVFFVANSANVAEGVEFNGNIVAKNNINVDGGATVNRMLSVSGKINGSVQSNLGGDTGSVQICKTVTTAGGTDISNRFFRFNVSGGPALVEVFVPPTPAGATSSTGCSAPFDVTAGPQTITEENLARLPNQTQATFSNFQLINVEQLNPPPPSPAGSSSLGAVNLGTRVAGMTVVAGGQEGVLVLRFTNVFAITGFVEICKNAATGPTTTAAFAGIPAGTFNPAPVGDIDVTGTFEFTVEGVYSLNRINAPGTSPAVTRTYQVFPVAVGQCSGPIAVTISNPPPTTTTPRESTVRVSELPRPGFFLESVTAGPTFDREVGANPATGAGGEVLGCIITPPTAIVTSPAPANAPVGTVTCNNSTLGGGFTTVRVIEGSAAAETFVNFNNRSNPGVVKVCKIAGPGIPLGTLFRFSVFGPVGTTGFTAPPATATANSPQFATYGPVAQIVDVTAGDPATGGNCALVPGLGAGVNRTEFQTFMNGTPVLVVENGISPANTVPVPPGAVRTSRIRVFGPATGTLVLQSGTGAATIGPIRAGFTPNQCAGFSATNNCSATNGLATAANNFNASGDTTPAPAGFDGRNPGNATPVTEPRIGRVAFVQRPGEVVAEFTNFIFNPTLLKVCKIAGGTLAPGGTFTFDVTLTGGGPTSGTGAGAVPLFPGNPTSTVSVTSARNEAATPFGNCDFVDGANFPGGGFNIGEPVTITERTATGTQVVRCDSPTNGGFLFPATGAPVVNRQCGFTAGGMIAGVNIVAFTNGPTAPVTSERTAFDFDGDGKADPSIFRPSTGFWSYAASSASNEIRSTKWGVSSDIAVAADYDGDGKSDLAVFRSGTWYIMGSAGAFRGEAFGTAGDIPQPGDYDGDGKADLAVFRPSNGTWYMQNSRTGFNAVQFGVSTDKPVAADYDGDGKTDQAVYRNGAWYMNKSTTGFAGVNWGNATDIPVPADYTGDGKADLTVYRGGMWYTLNDNGTTFRSVNWGTATDKPVPADYDGDRKADIAVYRNGMWYALPTTNSAQGFTSVSLGNGSDTPVPASLQ